MKSCGGDALFRDLDVLLEQREYLVFRLGVVILIHPADDLHLTGRFAVLVGVRNIEVAFRDIMGQVIDHAVLVCERNGQQQLGIISGRLEQLRQDLVQLVALLDKQRTKQLVQLVLVLELQHAVALVGREVQIGVKGRGDKIWLQLAGVLGGKNTDAGGEIVVDLHEPDGDHTVEPGVGDFLHHILERGLVVHLAGFIPDGSNKGIALGDLRALYLGVSLRADVKELQVLRGLRQRLGRAGFRHAEKPRLVCDLADELSPRPHSKILDRGFVHGVFPPFCSAFQMSKSMDTTSFYSV